MPAQYNYFGATAADVLHEFRGAANSDFDTSPGAGDGADELALALDRAEELLLAYLPPRYRRLLARVEGEIVEECAAAGQTAAALALPPAEKPNLAVWRDWPYRGTLPPLAARTDRYTLEEQTLTLLDPLAAGATVIASYDLDPAGWELPLLARALVALAAWLLAERMYAPGDPGWAGLRAGFDGALGLLRDLRDGRAGLPKLEALRLVTGSGEQAAGPGTGRMLGRA